MAELVLRAPLRGWLAPLEEVDDPVFAGRMLGDGLAIDPTGSELHAPCDGEVISIHAAGHAISLRAPSGAEILIHLGLETVGLGGEGFSRHVRDGQAVKAGDLLISFDLDVVAGGAKSLISPIVVTNGETFVIRRRSQDQRVEVGDPIMTLAEVASGLAPPRPGGSAVREVVVPLAHGLHARPSALVAAEAKRHLADITLTGPSGKTANAKSPVAIMALGLGHLDRARLAANGADAEAALTALADLIEHRLPPEPEPILATPAPAPVEKRSAPLGSLAGVPASPGLAIGVAARLIAGEPAVVAQSMGAEKEVLALASALAAVRTHLAALAGSGPRQQREIAAAHLAFADDEELLAAANAAIAAGSSAGIAWREATDAQVAVLRAVADRHIAARADDLVDLQRQVLIQLSGETEIRPALPPGAIVIAEDLGPAEFMAMGDSLAGVCLAGGGPTSHLAILAMARNIPAIVAIGPELLTIADGAALIVDGAAGLVRIAPQAEDIAAAQTRLAALHAEQQQARASAAEPCRTADGVRIEVLANLGSVAEAELAMANGAEGCGLLRTEFLFLERDREPGEAEQAEVYQAIASTLEELPLVIRTLDVGGDKPAAYLDLPREENPAMGLRGVRVSLARPDTLGTQLRAILRVKPEGQCRLLIPMVASVDEFLAVKAALESARLEVGRAAPIQLGVMIETPAAAMTADLIAAHADFLSVGTNDLTQYVLAMDRGNPQVAGGIDALHPGVLRMIAAAAAGGAKHRRPIAVCGGLAGDVAAAPLLIGLGVTELSVPPARLPEIKAAVRKLDLPACRELAAGALDCQGPAEVRALLVKEVKQ